VSIMEDIQKVGMQHVNAMGQITFQQDAAHTQQTAVPFVQLLKFKAERKRYEEEEEEEIEDIAERWRSRKSTVVPTNIQPLSVSKVADALELKAEASYRQSLAERTGNVALREQARFEQSIADRMGARKALISPKQDPATLKYNAAMKQSLADRSGDEALKRQASLQQSIADRTGARKALVKQTRQRKSRPRRFCEPPPEPPVNDLMALKYDSAIKQSIADRTGDVSLKIQASLEQSVADSLGARQALFQDPGHGSELPPDSLHPVVPLFENLNLGGTQEESGSEDE